MIPTKTLRERMIEAMTAELDRQSATGIEFDSDEDARDATVAGLVTAAIQAISDPCLIKTADTLEPTFTLRAQDVLSAGLVDQWARSLAEYDGCPSGKTADAQAWVAAALNWPDRKWPD